MSEIEVRRPQSGRSGCGYVSPIVLALFILVLALCLMLPLTVPIGPFYWDTFIYFDAANRIMDGQIPSVDFFAPAGPLGYWLFTGLNALYAHAQPALLAQWMILAVAGPLLALALFDIERHSRLFAFALLVPFLLFVAVPINGVAYSAYPGVDGFGYYNRQSIHLLYVLAATLLFVRDRAIFVIVVTGVMTALFLTKITGFAAGGLLCAYALLAGRTSLREGLLILAGFALVLAGLELSLGVISAYLADLWTLATMNEGVLAQRFLQASSMHFGILASGGLLVLALLAAERRDLLSEAAELRKGFRPAAARRILDHGALWLGAGLFAGLFFETQNTGSQPFVFVWPIALMVLAGLVRLEPRWRIVCLMLTMAMVLPSLVTTIQRAARAGVGQFAYVDLDLPGMKTLDAVNQRPEIVDRSSEVLDLYKRFPETFEAFANERILPSFTLYTEEDFQLTWLRMVSEGVAAIEAREAETGQRFETIFSLNFTNPFPYLLDRHAPKFLPIGADPSRTVPPATPKVLEELERTDLVLYPKCPINISSDEIYAVYADVLRARERIELSPCWDGLLRADAPARR